MLDNIWINSTLSFWSDCLHIKKRGACGVREATNSFYRIVTYLHTWYLNMSIYLPNPSAMGKVHTTQGKFISRVLLVQIWFSFC